MIENIKMVQDFVLVQVDPPEERTAVVWSYQTLGRNAIIKVTLWRSAQVAASSSYRQCWRPSDVEALRGEHTGRVVSGRGR